MLFAAESPWVWEAERTFAVLKEQNQMMSAADRSGSVDLEKKRNMSISHEERPSPTLG